jgi:hypothetical protein
MAASLTGHTAAPHWQDMSKQQGTGHTWVMGHPWPAAAKEADVLRAPAATACPPAKDAQQQGEECCGSWSWWWWCCMPWG